MILAIERATRSDAFLTIAAGVIFISWAVFVHRTGWTANAVASRVKGRHGKPRRGGFLYWIDLVAAATFGLIALVAGIGLLLR